MNLFNLIVGSRVQHRGWHWFGTVTQPPPSPLKWHSQITIVLDGNEKESMYPVYALLIDPADFLYDWSEINETT